MVQPSGFPSGSPAAFFVFVALYGRCLSSVSVRFMKLLLFHSSLRWQVFTHSLVVMALLFYAALPVLSLARQNFVSVRVYGLFDSDDAPTTIADIAADMAELSLTPLCSDTTEEKTFFDSDSDVPSEDAWSLVDIYLAQSLGWHGSLLSIAYAPPSSSLSRARFLSLVDPPPRLS